MSTAPDASVPTVRGRVGGATRLEPGIQPPRPPRVLRTPADLEPYTFFTGRTVDLDSARPHDIDAGLLAVIETEGPVMGTRAQSAYVKAMGGNRVTKVREAALNRSLQRLVTKGWVVSDAPLGERRVEERTYRLPHQPSARPRQRSNRSIKVVPPLDVIAILELVHRAEPALRGEALHRACMQWLEVDRKGRDVRERIEKCETAWLTMKRGGNKAQRHA